MPSEENHPDVEMVEPHHGVPTVDQGKCGHIWKRVMGRANDVCKVCGATRPDAERSLNQKLLAEIEKRPTLKKANDVTASIMAAFIVGGLLLFTSGCWLPPLLVAFGVGR